MQHKEIEEIELLLDDLKDDAAVPKNVRTRIERIIGVLNSNLEMQIKASKALNELEEIADDVNLQSYTRTQVWNAVSILEKINNKIK